MKKVLGILAALVALGVWLWPDIDQGRHVDLRLRVIDSEDGRPVDDESLVLVARMDMLEAPSAELEQLIRSRDGQPTLLWNARSRLHYDAYQASDPDPGVTEFAGAGRVEVYRFRFPPWSWFGPWLDVALPEALVVDHPRRGRIVIPVDPGVTPVEDEAGIAWVLDLGVIGLPPRPGGPQGK